MLKTSKQLAPTVGLAWPSFRPSAFFNREELTDDEKAWLDLLPFQNKVALRDRYFYVTAAMYRTAIASLNTYIATIVQKLGSAGASGTVA